MHCNSIKRGEVICEFIKSANQGVYVLGRIWRSCKDLGVFSPSMRSFQPRFVICSQLLASQQIYITKVIYCVKLILIDCKKLNLLRGLPKFFTKVQNNRISPLHQLRTLACIAYYLDLIPSRL